MESKTRYLNTCFEAVVHNPFLEEVHIQVAARRFHISMVQHRTRRDRPDDRSSSSLVESDGVQCDCDVRRGDRHDVRRDARCCCCDGGGDGGGRRGWKNGGCYCWVASAIVRSGAVRL